MVCTAPIRGKHRLTPVGARSLASHHFHRQPLKVAALFCLLILATRERVYKFFHADLVCRTVFLQLIFYVLFYYPFIFAYGCNTILWTLINEGT